MRTCYKTACYLLAIPLLLFAGTAAAEQASPPAVLDDGMVNPGYVEKKMVPGPIPVVPEQIAVGIPADLSPEEALKDNNRYKVIWQVLQALRAHDDRFNATVNI